MKTATKIVSKLLAATLALTLGAAALTSCGSGASYTDGNTEYFIGATGPLTGDASSYGISVEKGAELAVEEINAQGGLNGVTFHFEMLDDGATADKAATAYTLRKGYADINRKRNLRLMRVICGFIQGRQGAVHDSLRVGSRCYCGKRLRIQSVLRRSPAGYYRSRHPYKGLQQNRRNLRHKRHIFLRYLQCV